MKNPIFSTWVRPLKFFFVSSIVLSLSFSVAALDEVWAQSKSQIIAQQIKTLQQSDRRWIQVKLKQQKLIAWEGRKPVYAIVVSTGKKSTPTRTGVFQIQTKHKSTRMRGRGYDVSNVPHTMYYSGGYAIHGAYWHRKFGTPVSHGCVNVAPNHAKWLFDWASLGTPVVIQG
ncbi:MAG: L,D-transpeptidase [Scytonema sp. PMC 1069.18]|nr:L,D-transpeptidase [Scytonema sp. PMC 1069.18]MEC4881624.1 L,D-transpeptidase [Scytonema sp. PMC 1070.18]